MIGKIGPEIEGGGGQDTDPEGSAALQKMARELGVQGRGQEAGEEASPVEGESSAEAAFDKTKRLMEAASDLKGEIGFPRSSEDVQKFVDRWNEGYADLGKAEMVHTGLREVVWVDGYPALERRLSDEEVVRRADKFNTDRFLRDQKERRDGGKS